MSTFSHSLVSLLPAGLQGKLQKLQRSTVDLSPENLGEAHNDGMLALDQLLEGCVSRRRQGR